MSMMRQPMIEQDMPPIADAVVVANLPNDKTSAFEEKASALRRAATALLLFSVLCMRPCPLSSVFSWLGVIAAISVLCATPKKLLCRARVARFLAAIVAIFAVCQLVGVTSSITSMPLRISETVDEQCVKAPAETFEWGQQMISERKHLRGAAAFLMRHLTNGTVPHATLASTTDANATLVDIEAWSQPEACHQIALLVKNLAKATLFGSALAHLLLLLSALAVVKRACRLRCAGYRLGLLTWKRCGCKHTSKPALVEATATKELA